VLWDSYLDEPANVRLNSLPWTTGPALEATYAVFLRPQVKKGDVLVVDQFQDQTPVIDPSQPGWKVIGRCRLVYGGVSGTHGYNLTAYQKE